MTQIHSGDRIGRNGHLRVGCSAAIFDEDGTRVLLTRRSDNGMWCLPSGAMDPGESAEEACQREVWEETGLQVEVLRLAGIYTTPNELVEYPDGTKVQIVALSFVARITAGEPSLSDETTAFGWFTPSEMEALQMVPSHALRVRDAFANQAHAFIR